MNAAFKLDGCYTLELTDSGYLSSPDGVSGACSKGNVGIQVLYAPLALGNVDEGPGAPMPQKSVLQAFLKPSQARAIASALLSAATEARAA